MRKVLDSYALMAFFEKEPGYELVEQSLIDAAAKNQPLLMSVVNYGEIYYIVSREYGKARVEEVEKAIQTAPIELVDVDLTLAREAARFKALYKISYADCFAAALAKHHKAELITGDREFKLLKDEIKISWI